MAGSQKSGPTVGGRMNRAEGSRAPNGVLRGDPPCIPGKPRPTVVTRVLLRDCTLGAKRLVVTGVMILAEIPLVGAERGSMGEITAGVSDCWAEPVPGAIWADPADHSPSRRQQQDARISLLSEITGRNGELGAIFSYRLKHSHRHALTSENPHKHP